MLENLKMMLGIDGTDLDKTLELIIANTEARLKVLLGNVDAVPETLEYITLEVSIIRFNRIGSEGLTSHTVEGESLAFAGSDFDAFANDIQDYLDSKNGNPDKGGFRFL